jgi:hypothetical protein
MTSLIEELFENCPDRLSLNSFTGKVPHTADRSQRTEIHIAASNYRKNPSVGVSSMRRFVELLRLSVRKSKMLRRKFVHLYQMSQTKEIVIAEEIRRNKVVED